MANDAIQPSRDWLGSTRASALAWWVPQAAIVVALSAPVSLRAVIWLLALIWMGTACGRNSRRCGRTHCRYTGPYYLVMIVPVLVVASGVISAGISGGLTCGVVILAGGKIIWWVTEFAWGRFS